MPHKRPLPTRHRRQRHSFRQVAHRFDVVALGVDDDDAMDLCSEFQHKACLCPAEQLEGIDAGHAKGLGHVGNAVFATQLRIELFMGDDDGLSKAHGLGNQPRIGSVEKLFQCSGIHRGGPRSHVLGHLGKSLLRGGV